MSITVRDSKRRYMLIMPLLAMVLMLLFSCKVLAGEENVNLEGVQTEIPSVAEKGSLADMEVSLYGLSVASTSSVYEFGKAHWIEGEAYNVDLYSNKNFYGAKTITMTITNELDEDLVIRLRKNNFFKTTVSKFTIPANSSYYVSIENLDKETYYYFQFAHKCKFYGYVTGYKY